MGGYQPVLEQQLNQAKNSQPVQKETENHPPNCADEFAQAQKGSHDVIYQIEEPTP